MNKEEIIKNFKFVCLLAGLFLFLPVAHSDGYDSEVTVSIDGEIIEVESIIVNDRTMIPIRSVLEHLGAQVGYSNGTVWIKDSFQTISLQAENHEVLINQEKVIVDQPPIIHNQTSYVPVRLLSNALGYKAFFDSENKEVQLTTEKNQTVISGYVEDSTGKPMTSGTLRISNQINSKLLSIDILQGFYRVVVNPGSYELSAILPSETNNYNILSGHQFNLEQGEKIFNKVTLPPDNMEVKVIYPDGTPVKSASLSIQIANHNMAIDIENGIWSGHVPLNLPVNIYTININETDDLNWDVHFSKNQIDENEQQLTITVQRSNVTFLVEKAEGLYNIIIGISGITKPKYLSTIGYKLKEGSKSIYLQDGSYIWEYVTYGENRADLSIPFKVVDGVADRSLEWTVPIQDSVE